MAAGVLPVAVPTMDNGQSGLMLQGRGGTQVHVKTRIAGSFNAFRGMRGL
jgi:hypothetical protein